MEVEYNSQSITWDYDLFSTLSFPSQEADLKDKLNLDVMRKHYYEDILAATCLFLNISL